MITKLLSEHILLCCVNSWGSAQITFTEKSQELTILIILLYSRQHKFTHNRIYFVSIIQNLLFFLNWNFEPCVFFITGDKVFAWFDSIIKFSFFKWHPKKVYWRGICIHVLIVLLHHETVKNFFNITLYFSSDTLQNIP